MDERYSRQLMIPQVGEEGQKKWLSSRVLVIGAGGLGCPLLMLLAGAGVGSIAVMDGDTVSRSNLNRQFLYTPADLGRQKAELAVRRLQAFSPQLAFTAIPAALTRDNAGEVLSGYDLVLLAVDNLPTRLLANEFCQRNGTPLVNGGVEGLYGNVMTVEFGQTPCLRCFYSKGETPPKAGAAIGTVSTAVASLMANAALWMLLGQNPLAGKLLLYDGSRLTAEQIALHRAESCPICGNL